MCFDKSQYLAYLVYKFVELSRVLVVDDIDSKDRSVAHLVVRPQALDKYPEFSTEGLQKLISSTLAANTWPAWQVSAEYTITYLHKHGHSTGALSFNYLFSLE